MTTFTAANDECFIKMTTFPFDCIPAHRFSHFHSIDQLATY